MARLQVRLPTAVAAPLWPLLVRPMILVTGPESSGSGATAALVRGMGFEVLHRAVPHINDWYPFDSLPDDDYVMVVTHREPWALLNSQIKHGQANTIREAEDRVTRAYRYIFDEGFLSLPITRVVPVTYEGLFDYRGVAGLAKLLGVEPNVTLTPLENRNAQY